MVRVFGCWRALVLTRNRQGRPSECVLMELLLLAYPYPSMLLLACAFAGIHRRCPAFSGVNTKTKDVQLTRKLHQQLTVQPGCRQRMLSGHQHARVAPTTRHNRLSATPHSNDGHFASAAPSSWRPARQTFPNPASSAAGLSRGGDASFTAATKLQQQQYVRHVQQDIPGVRQQAAQPQPQHWQVEARNRSKSGQSTSTEPVHSYEQLFAQDMTPTASSASGARLTRQTSSSSSKGFGKAKPRRSGSSSSANGAGPSQLGKEAVTGAAHVRLCITRAVEFGQNMRVTGSGPEMGAWNADKGPKLKWNDGHKWTADVTLAPGA